MSEADDALDRLEGCITRVEDGVIIVGRTSEEDADAALATVRQELQRLREERDAARNSARHNSHGWQAAEAAVRRYREGLREAVDMIRFPCAECKPFIDKARALLADSPSSFFGIPIEVDPDLPPGRIELRGPASPDGANPEGGEA